MDINKYCHFCDKNIDTNKWVKHCYTKKHRNNFRIKNQKPLSINNNEISIQTIKLDCLNLLEDINNIINKIKTLEKT